MPSVNINMCKLALIFMNLPRFSIPLTFFFFLLLLFVFNLRAEPKIFLCRLVLIQIILSHIRLRLRTGRTQIFFPFFFFVFHIPPWLTYLVWMDVRACDNNLFECIIRLIESVNCVEVPFFCCWCLCVCVYAALECYRTSDRTWMKRGLVSSPLEFQLQ